MINIKQDVFKFLAAHFVWRENALHVFVENIKSRDY